MLAGDYMTKPLQGALFRKFRDQIMGLVPARDPGPGKVKPGDSILRIRKVKPIGVTAKRAQFTDSESNTRKVKPSKGRVARKSLVPPSERYHRSVLGAVAPRT